MKNFQQNLLILLAIALCGLCAYQWHAQSVQRDEIAQLNQIVYQKSVSIRNDTNSIAILNHQISEMDSNLTALRAEAKTNAETIASQKRELMRLEAVNDGLTNEMAQYKDAVGTLTNKLVEAYAGIKKQNDALKELAAHRDEFVKKYNDSVKERNEIVGKYNDLVAKVEKMQGGEGNK